MSYKTSDSGGTLARKARGKRIASLIGAPIIAGSIAFSSPFFEGRGEASDVPQEVVERWMEAGHPMMREAYQTEKESEDFAGAATETYLKTREADVTFKTEFGYTDEQCRECAILDTDVARENSRIASEAGIDEELAQAVVYQESNMNGYRKNGKVKRSGGGGYNEWQVTYQGFKEFWKILTKNNEDRYSTYIKKHSDEISHDSNAFRDHETGKYIKKKDAWKRVKLNRGANRIAGKTLLKFYMDRENGDMFEALRDYNSGESGKNKEYREDSIRYAESVLEHKKLLLS